MQVITAGDEMLPGYIEGAANISIPVFLIPGFDLQLLTEIVLLYYQSFYPLPVHFNIFNPLRRKFKSAFFLKTHFIIIISCINIK